MTEEERQRHADAAMRRGSDQLPRLNWQPYSALPGAWGQTLNDAVHVTLEWRPDLALGLGMWECRVNVRNLQVAEFKAVTAGGAAVDARDVIAHLHAELGAVLRAKRPRRS